MTYVCSELQLVNYVYSDVQLRYLKKELAEANVDFSAYSTDSLAAVGLFVEFAEDLHGVTLPGFEEVMEHFGLDDSFCYGDHPDKMSAYYDDYLKAVYFDDCCSDDPSGADATTSFVI